MMHSPQEGDLVLGNQNPSTNLSSTGPRIGDMTLGFQPSQYQRAIFDWLESCDGSCVVSAVPGSGKTTTLIKGVNYIPKKLKSKFLAFNQHIAEELSTKLPAHIKASTIHSLGLSSINKKFKGCNPEIYANKYQSLIAEYLRERKIVATAETKRRIKALIKFVQLTMADFTNINCLKQLNREYGLLIPPFADWGMLRRYVIDILDRGAAQAQNVISYDDMIWLPCHFDYPMYTYDFLFVDEAQDLNKGQLALILKAQKSGARGIFVGDEHQAIMGFSGSDYRSIGHITEKTKAMKLPLSICYRCPTSHIELANQIHNIIEPHPNAPSGKVSHIRIGQIPEIARVSDLIICRCLYPLISVYYALLQADIPAFIKNKEMAATLISLLEQIVGEEDKDFSKIVFREVLIEWYEFRKKEMLDNEVKAMVLADLHERISTLNSLYSVNNCQDTRQLRQIIDKLTKSANNRECVYLTTVHGAKGLEADRVFIVRPDLMPHPKAEDPWELEQENNLKFVGLTRAKQELFFCN